MKIDLTNLLFPFMKIDLKDPQLGSKLLEDPKGYFPLEVWIAYCTKSGHYPVELLSWCEDPSDPQTAALDPQQAVDEALSCANETTVLLMRKRFAEAFLSNRRTINTLLRGSSDAQPKKGQPASMRPIAVRAWIIGKYNPTSLAELADKLFLKDGKCPRKNLDGEGSIVPRKGRKRTYKLCGLSRHQYDSDCVKALRTRIGKLKSEMKAAGIPL